MNKIDARALNQQMQYELRQQVVRINAKKSCFNMMSSITNRGKVRFMLYEKSMTAKVLITFMSRLIKDSERKIFLILDNLRIHHSKAVKAGLEDHKEQIEVLFLPSHSPELYPVGYLNSDLKQNIRSGLPARSAEDLKKKTRSFMCTLQNRSTHVRQYFKHPKIAHAA